MAGQRACGLDGPGEPGSAGFRIGGRAGIPAGTLLGFGGAPAQEHGCEAGIGGPLGIEMRAQTEFRTDCTLQQTHLRVRTLEDDYRDVSEAGAG